MIQSATYFTLQCFLAGVFVLAGFDTSALAGCSREGPVEPAVVAEVSPGHFVRFGVHALMTSKNAGGIANIGFVVGDAAVAVIDTGGSACDGQRLRAAIRTRTNLPIRFVIATHVHPDHVFGHAAFAEDNTVFIGHANLKAALAARGAHYLASNREVLAGETDLKTRVIMPDTLVSSEDIIDLGGRTLRIRAHGAAHTDNDLTVYDPATQTLWTGDLLFRGHLPVIDGSLSGWLKVIDAVAVLPVRTVVPGHGTVGRAWPSALGPQRVYLTQLAADLRRLIAEGATIAEAIERATPADRSNWKLVEEFHPRNVTAGFVELEWE